MVVRSQPDPKLQRSLTSGYPTYKGTLGQSPKSQKMWWAEVPNQYQVSPLCDTPVFHQALCLYQFRVRAVSGVVPPVSHGVSIKNPRSTYTDHVSKPCMVRYLQGFVLPTIPAPPKSHTRSAPFYQCKTSTVKCVFTKF